MFVRRPAGLSAGLSRFARGALLAATLCSGFGCVAVHDPDSVPVWKQKPEEHLQLTDAEEMIDELDRILTDNGTISVKTPDVWGQDRLAKFRAEYELQMGEWLKQGFKSDVNAAVRRSESQTTQVQMGAAPALLATQNAAAQNQNAVLPSLSQSLANLNATAPTVLPNPNDKPSVSLEPTVLLDEHSNYLNHLNQLRRINAGDDLADRPGYGLYLVRIPVTLSPGPRSRRGKGAIITVSAKPIMTKHTLESALRNTVINEAVDNLSQAIGMYSKADDDRPVGPGHSSYSLVDYADSELIYGRPNIDLLRGEAELQLARDLDAEPHHRTARIAEWLRGELESSYHVLQHSATPRQSAGLVTCADPLDELGDRIVKRDFAAIAKIQLAGKTDPQVKQVSAVKGAAAAVTLEERRGAFTQMLSFALRIQAAAVNHRLKQDMVDQDHTIKAESLRQLSFFEPEVSDEAFRAFEEYVRVKWPLRVYAIEPVIAQQNVADAFYGTKRSVIQLVGAAPLATWRGFAGLASDHTAADEETAIRLNPTMVGFGAGQSTFGWIFYPRLQTNRSSRGILTDVALLLNGRILDPMGNSQMIEPGQRECTALVEMPNFVPKIEFVTVTNWFRTSEVVDGQKSLEKASTLIRKLDAAEKQLNRTSAEGKYGPDEYEIAMDRIKQLKDMMPTQRMVIRVPFSGDHNDARIFCSQGLQLRPSLLGWHGRPPEKGQESTIYVEGRNFSVHDTLVIAGGKPAKVMLISRNLLQVTIPNDALPTPSAQGDLLLDIDVATPNGASNHLLIKMAKPHPDGKPPHDEQRPPPPPEPLLPQDIWAG